MGGNFFFPSYTNVSIVELSLILLAVRVIFGFMMLSHGMQKIKNYRQLEDNFPDPLKIGSKASVTMAIFGEFVCSIGFITGCLFKFALIALMINMLVALLVDAKSKKFAVMEPALLYLIIFIIMFIAGPGIFSLDYFI